MSFTQSHTFTENTQNFSHKPSIFCINRLYEFPSNKTEHINAFLNTALVKKNMEKIKLSYGFVLPQNIRSKISKNVC